MDLSEMLNPSSPAFHPSRDDVDAVEPLASQTNLDHVDVVRPEDNIGEAGTSASLGLADVVEDSRHEDHEAEPIDNAEPLVDTGEASPEMPQMDDTRSPKPRIKVEPTIKSEPAATPRDNTPASAIEASSLDEATMKAIKDAQNEYSTRRVGRKAIVDKQPTPELEPPKPIPSKKRSAPKPDSLSIDGLPPGVKKPPPKKRKVQKSEDSSTPAPVKRSSTPSSTNGGGRSAKNNAKAGRKSSTAGTTTGSSPHQASSPAAVSEAASDVEDDGAVYCICRRPDDHTIMIACDGACDDWFHMKCVNIKKEDRELLDKYICPICTEKETSGVTTWKPMCRRPGCRKPARVTKVKKGQESKYCSDECGVAFMRSKVQPASAAARRTTHHHKSSDEADLGPLGGAIRSHELKALALAAPNCDTFRRLGSSEPLTPPPSSPTETLKQQNPFPPSSHALDPNALRLQELAARKAALRARHGTLKDRERFIVMVKERTARLLAATKLKEPKTKEVCGYDGRLSLDDATFATWRRSEEGVAVFKSGMLDAVIEQESEEAAADDGAGSALLVFGGVCTRKRCLRHVGWPKLALNDVRFEEAEVGAEMRRVEEEERGIRRAVGVGVGLDVAGGGLKEGKGDTEEGGWVEVVGVEVVGVEVVGVEVVGDGVEGEADERGADAGGVEGDGSEREGDGLEVKALSGTENAEGNVEVKEEEGGTFDFAGEDVVLGGVEAGFSEGRTATAVEAEAEAEAEAMHVDGVED